MEGSPETTREDFDLEQALDELRHRALRFVAPVLLALGWLWGFGNMMVNGIATNRDLPALGLVASMTVILIVHRRRPRLACWLFLPALVLVQALIVRFYPTAASIYFGIVGVIVLSPVLGAWHAIAGAAALWAVGAGMLLRGNPAFRPDLPVSLAFYALATGAVWFAGRSLRLAVSWALTGWQRAQDALQETRARRGELYRTLRALEEATYRIERMNSELILARGEAEEARAAKARFVATVSHEIRGPLNLILGFSRLMALSPERYNHPLPTDYRADVVTIYRNSQHLASLVDDILDMSQVEAERLPLIKERVDLEAEVVSEALQIAKPLAERKGLWLHLDLHGALPHVLIDPVRIRQVVLNILMNAARFTEAGGITLRTRLEEKRVVVSIADTGPGIAPSDLSHLFKAFQQLSPADRGDGKGSGLGLSISKQLVELHGGEIWAESEVGIGTSVSFSLPLPGVTETVSRPRRSQGGGASREKDHVLVIHQDPATVKILSRYLEGYRIIGLPDDGELVAVVEELHPRAIIATGDHVPLVHQRLSTLDYDVPLIACAMPRVVAGGSAEGVLGCLIKPVSREMLLAVIGRLDHGGELTVLIVDDDLDTLRLLETMLLAIPQPYRILKALDGTQALQVMDTETPDVVLVDLVMPGMGGEELIARMRHDPRLAAVPVVIVSAKDWSEEAVSIGLPISVSRRAPLSMRDATQCLLSIINVVHPRYLPDADLLSPSPEPAQRSQPALPH